jgi:5-methyltetrahydropteroyltriglutamate--homocysteine methyltransferase
VRKLPLIPTTVMGSYPQPAWLVHDDRLVGSRVPRVRNDGIWKVDAEDRLEAIQAATLMAIRDQELAGVDIITDGEIGRESYFNHFANSLGGVDKERLGVGVNRLGAADSVPLVNGPIVREHPIELEAAQFLRTHTNGLTKVTVPGPFTLSQLAQNDYYPDQQSLAMAYATAINAELRDLQALGIDVLQLDEPYLQANAAVARGFAIEAVAAAVDGITATTTLHTCYGYAVYVSDKTGGYPFFAELALMPVDWVAVETAQPQLDPAMLEQLAPRGVVMGVLDLGRETAETAEEIMERVQVALRYVDKDKLSLGPDCGMKFLPRSVAQAKLRAMADAAAALR